MITTELKAIDFFCGAGGMTSGFAQANIKVIGGVDFDASCKETYEYNNPGSKFLNADITKLTEEQVESFFSISRNDDTAIFIGCSPCQYWSIIKTKKEKASKSKDLLADFQRFVEYFKPGFVVIENVLGIASNSESPLELFKAFLKENGYVFNDKRVNTLHYGIPQQRRRYVLIASRVVSKEFFPEEDRSHYPKVIDFIGEHNGFPAIEAGHKDTSDFQHSVANLKEVNIKRLKKTPHNGGTRLSWKDDPELQLKTYIGRDDQFVDIYGRMYWNKPGPTITTKFFSLSNGRFAHPEEDRALSIREGATLQTFPKEYVFKGSTIEKNARMIGNAVPPLLAKKIASSIIENYKTQCNSEQKPELLNC